MPPLAKPSFALLVIVAGLFVLTWRLIVWVREARNTPDPWDTEVDEALRQPEVVEVCHHCFAAQPSAAKFCAECGSAVGAYNNLLPFEYIFSMGETLRTGVVGRYRVNFVTICGFFLWSLSQYMIFAPIYWFHWIRNLAQMRNQPGAPEPNTASL